MIIKLSHVAFGFLNIIITAASEIYGLKSIAAYRSGLDINPTVSMLEAKEGLGCTLRGKQEFNVSLLMLYGLRYLSISCYSWNTYTHFKQKPY